MSGVTRRGAIQRAVAAAAAAGATARAQDEPSTISLPLLLHGAESRCVRHVRFGTPFTAAEPRGPLGTVERDPALRRTTSLAARTHLEFVTAPFVVPDKPLRLNVDVLHGTAALTQGAYALVEVLDDGGQPIPGYLRAGCVIGNVNALDHLLLWEGKNTVELAGRTVSLRFLVRDIRLYAVHTTEYVRPPITSLVAAVSADALEPWQTATLTLRATAADGTPLPLDHHVVELTASDPALVGVRLDPRDRGRATVTAHRDLDRLTQVTVRAAVEVDGRKVAAPPLSVAVRPLARPATAADFTLLFVRPADIRDIKGNIAFEANTLEYFADTRGLPTTPKAMTLFNRKIGSEYHVWGSSREAGGLFRATTANGLDYAATPLRATIDPSHLIGLAYNPKADEYCAFERAFGPQRWIVHKSTDGTAFTRAGAAYEDFDGVKLVWDQAKSSWTALQLSFQQTATPRLFPDNLGAISTRLGNRGRRIFTRRTSADGLHWTPAKNTRQEDPKSWAEPADYAIVPDAADPPDLECYWADVFPYGDHYLGLLMTYAPAPPEFLAAFRYDAPPTIKHGPHVGVEWVVSTDLKTWARPFRSTPAARDWRIYFAHAPLVVHDRMLFLTANQLYNLGPLHGARGGQNMEVYGLPLHRFVSAGGPAGSAFSTKPFVAPAGPLYANVSGSLAVEVLGADGAVVPGYEARRCAWAGVDDLHRKLAWDGVDTAVLAGRTVQLRFHCDRARVYSAHTLA